MDNYTKMCDCPEIQGLWEPKVGDWIFHKPTKTSQVVIVDFELHGDKYVMLSSRWETLKKDCIWLPGIRQLMGMVPNEPAWDYCYSKFSNWLDTELGIAVFNQVDSMQELWLAFVMSELHGLKWSESEGWA